MEFTGVEMRCVSHAFLAHEETFHKGEMTMQRIHSIDPQAATGSARAALPAWVSSLSARPTYQAYLILHIGFAGLPIIAGLAKLFQLVNMEQYLAPLVTEHLPFSGHTFMIVVGVIEIAAGLLVALRPRIGAYIVMLWLWGIIANLLLIPRFL
jgi:hypothetical protein